MIFCGLWDSTYTTLCFHYKFPHFEATFQEKIVFPSSDILYCGAPSLLIRSRSFFRSSVCFCYIVLTKAKSFVAMKSARRRKLQFRFNVLTDTWGAFLDMTAKVHGFAPCWMVQNLVCVPFPGILISYRHEICTAWFWSDTYGGLEIPIVGVRMSHVQMLSFFSAWLRRDCGWLGISTPVNEVTLLEVSYTVVL